MKRIGTPDRWFYTGMPPILLGGSGSNSVCIGPYSVFVFGAGGSSGFPAESLIAYPPRVSAREKFKEMRKNAR
jgi:hypothetical protein